MNEQRELEQVYCPFCHQHGEYVGTLGSVDHFRCCACGYDFARFVNEKEQE
jgi:transposase-like protein